jgi:Predicted transcriptional regulator containing an HTH domain and an uncharacterized domain shared with the mammalian protein Schlafen
LLRRHTWKKEATRIDIARTLVAFANAEGGELFIGVEDDTQISGVPYDDKKIQFLLDATKTHVHKDTPLPSLRSATIDFQGKTILYFSVIKGTDFIYLTSDGRCLKRKDTESLPVSTEKISALRLEDRSREYERQIADGASITDLDIDLIKSISGQITYGVSVEKCLQYLDLGEFGLEGLSLRKAALLLFAKDIKRWYPACNVISTIPIQNNGKTYLEREEKNGGLQM